MKQQPINTAALAVQITARAFFNLSDRNVYCENIDVRWFPYTIESDGKVMRNEIDGIQ